MSLVTAHRERYLQCAHDAFRKCEAKLLQRARLSFAITEYSGRSAEAVREQWEPFGRDHETAWDWAELVRHYRKDPDTLAMAVWSGERLSSLCLATTSGNAVHIRYLEGDPRADCPLRGCRALIALEACAGYAQSRGKTELRVHPLNDRLKGLYVDTYGFDVCSPKKAEPYLFKRVP